MVLDFNDAKTQEEAAALLDDLVAAHSRTGREELSKLGLAALDYAERGWKIFPCWPGKKAPHEKLAENGFLDATDDLEQIEEWWAAEPAANIGLALDASGLVALDPDTYKPECGWGAFIKGREIPDTLVQLSARGGQHYIFEAPEGAAFPGKLCTGVEIKHAGYILLEPSYWAGDKEHPGGWYVFETDTDPAPLPEWVPRRDAAPAAPEGQGVLDFNKASVPFDADAALRRIKAGEAWHEPVRDLVARWVAKGLGDEEILLAAGQFTQPGYTLEDTRRDVQRMIDGARRKGYAPAEAPGKESVEPRDLFGPRQPLTFPDDVLPEPLRSFAHSTSAKMGAPLSLTAMAALGAAVAAIDTRACVDVDGAGWREHPILWLAGIAPASAKKTPVQKNAFSSIAEHEAESAQAADEAWGEYRDALEIYKKRRTKYLNAVADEKDEIPERPVAPDKPSSERLTVQDTTVEGLAKVLETNPQGVTLVADELSAWIGSMDAYSSGGGRGGASKDRGTWLQAYNGGRYTVDRKGTDGDAPSVLVENFAVSVCGFIQPSTLRENMKRLPTDGFLQRFAPFIGDAAELGDPEAADPAAARAFHDLIRHLCQQDAGHAVIEPTDEARAVARRWWAEEMFPILRTGSLEEEITSHFAKVEGNVWRWALVFHFVECAANSVFPSAVSLSAETVRRAIRLHDEYLNRTILHLYEVTLGGTDAQKVEHSIARWLLAEERGQFDVRDLTRGVRAFNKLPDDRAKMTILRRLEDDGWIWQADPTELRTLPRQWIANPSLRERFAEHVEAEQKRRAEVKAKLDAMRGENGEGAA